MACNPGVLPKKCPHHWPCNLLPAMYKRNRKEFPISKLRWEMPVKFWMVGWWLRLVKQFGLALCTILDQKTLREFFSFYLNQIWWPWIIDWNHPTPTWGRLGDRCLELSIGRGPDELVGGRVFEKVGMRRAFHDKFACSAGLQGCSPLLLQIDEIDGARNNSFFKVKYPYCMS